MSHEIETTKNRHPWTIEEIANAEFADGESEGKIIGISVSYGCNSKKDKKESWPKVFSQESAFSAKEEATQ